MTRVNKAVRAGLAAWLGTTLLLTTVLTAFWAGQTEFPGHTHPPGTPDHVHQLKEVGISGTLAFVLAVMAVSLPVQRREAEISRGLVAQVRRHAVNCARAPPCASA